MNGIHDMGGMDGFGPVVPEKDEPVFHAAWERRLFALSQALPVSVPFSDDHLRREIERLPPADYLRMSYYELWLQAIRSLLAERGILPGGRARIATQPLLAPAMVDATIAAGATTRQPDEGVMARFLAGDGVVARNIHPAGHTRLPRYVRDKPGVVVADRGVFSFPDANAAGEGLKPQHVYTVAFDARALWGDDTTADRVCVDLWEDYLEAR
ncbi:MAG TPA: nitrile hydratase subunit beta [Candidatus Acidoferrum sp.]|nr:nitrile hydratase subunit beta [Candidatus Acidoferrum sp.]